MPVIRKTIIVRDQELLISIGVHAHEKLALQRLLVSVEVDVMDAGDEGDDLSATFDYDRAYNFIKALGQAPHKLLQETVARRVLDFLLAQKGVLRAVVETKKPDVFTDCDFVGVRLEGTP